MRIPAVVSLLALAACSASGYKPGKYADYPVNPWTEFRTIAVLPVGLHPGLRFGLDARQFGSVFATELAKFGGTAVVRPSDVEDEVAAIGHRLGVDEATALARKLGADAVMALVVTDYDPYAPPKMAVQVEVVAARASTAARAARVDIDALVRSGRWGQMPVAMDPRRPAHFAAVFELVRDAHFGVTREAARSFAASGAAGDSPFSDIPDDAVYRSDRFWQFVSNEIVREFFARAPATGGETDGQPRQR
jgi:hypothetical protein